MLVNSERRTLWLAILTGVVVIVLAWWLRGRGEPASEAPTVAREVYAPAATAPPAITVDKPLIEGGSPTVTLLEKSLADFRASAVYPHWSRPLSSDTVEKLDWNRTVVSDLPMDDRPGHETTYHFGAERYTVPYGEPFVSWIEVVTVGPDPRRLPIEVSAAQIISVEHGRIAPLVFHDDGLDGDAVAGDHRYTNRFVPSEQPKLRGKAQQVHLQAIVKGGGVTRSITRDFAYAPRQAAQITGARDELRDGNLVITLDVEVAEHGLYTFEANVLGADGTPIVYGERSYTLEPGKRTAEVAMFGKAIHDKGVDGPYAVRDIRGFRRFIDTDEQNFYFTYPTTLTTRPYAAGEFSGSEWDAPEKRDTIAAFERLIAQTEAGEIGQPESDQPAPGPIAQPAVEPPLPPVPPNKPHGP